MNASELRAKSAEELLGMLAERRKEAFNLRFQKATGELQNTARIRQVRREVALIQTLLTQKKNSDAATAA